MIVEVGHDEHGSAKKTVTQQKACKLKKLMQLVRTHPMEWAPVSEPGTQGLDP